MNVQERRKRPRNSSTPEESSFIEIRHTFGPVRKSVYRVVEFNEDGISFLVPVSDGYFNVGFPLEYCLVKSDLTKVESRGVVRYYHPFNDHQGNSYYKIGVETGPANGIHPRNLRIRPERYKLKSLQNKHAISFMSEEQEVQLPLVDISRYSAAFRCAEEASMALQVSNTIESVLITFGAKTIFHGTVVISHKDVEEDGCRIVVEPRNAVFNVEAIDEQETLTAVASSVDSLLVTLDKYQTIDNRFKALVADMRAFLEGYQKILDMPVAAKLSKETDDTPLLDELNKRFYSQYDGYVEELDRTVSELNLSEREHGLYKSYFQRHFHPLLMASPFCHRMFFKPLGYPADYEMMRMMRENRYEGPTLFSKLVNKHALQNPLSAASRNAIEYLVDGIVRVAEDKDGAEVRIMSIGSGPAVEIQRLIEKRPDISNRVHVTLIDRESDALKYAQDSIYMKRIMNDSAIQLELIHRNIGAFLKQAAQGKAGMPPFDFIYAFDLFDYFDGRTCAYCINMGAKLLKDDGKMLISNYSLEGHHLRTYVEYAFEWYMIYRNADQMKKIAGSLAGPVKASVEEDSTGVIKFLNLQFGGA